MNFNAFKDLDFNTSKLLRVPLFVALAAALLAMYVMAIGTPGAVRAATPAQGDSHVFSGAAFIDGQAAPQGTVVAVLDTSGTQIASVSVDASGQYSNLQVPTAGISVNFTVDGLSAAETADTKAGGSTTLNLNVTRPQTTPPASTPVPAPTNTPASAPADTPVPAPTNTPAPAPENTPVPPPTNTPGPTPTPPASFLEAFRQGPTVRLRPVNDVIDQYKDGIVELLFRNPALNETVMVVDLTVSVPAGIHIYGEGYAQSSAAGAASNTYRVLPGQSQTLKLFIKSEKVGQFTIDFSSVYWPEGNKDLNNPVSLTHPFNVLAASPDPLSSTPTDPSEQIAAVAPTSAPAPAQPAQSAPQQGGDPSASCSLSPDGSASGADIALLVMPIAGIVGMLAIRRRRD